MPSRPTWQTPTPSKTYEGERSFGIVACGNRLGTVVYFLSPTEVHNKSDISFNKKIRVGGMVKMGSINREDNKINFIINNLFGRILYVKVKIMFK